VGIFAEEIVTTDTLGRRTGPWMRHTIEEKLRIVEPSYCCVIEKCVSDG
jgi:hypothetical protein